MFKSAIRAIRNAENEIRDLPIETWESLAEQQDIDALYIADELSKLADSLEMTEKIDKWIHE